MRDHKEHTRRSTPEVLPSIRVSSSLCTSEMHHTQVSVCPFVVAARTTGNSIPVRDDATHAVVCPTWESTKTDALL